MHHHRELTAQVVGIGPGSHRPKGFLALAILPWRVGNKDHFPVVVDLHHLSHVFAGEVLAVLEKTVTDGLRGLELVERTVRRFVFRQHWANDDTAPGLRQNDPLLQFPGIRLDNWPPRLVRQVNRHVNRYRALVVEQQR